MSILIMMYTFITIESSPVIKYEQSRPMPTIECQKAVKIINDKKQDGLFAYCEEKE